MKNLIIMILVLTTGLGSYEQKVDTSKLEYEIIQNHISYNLGIKTLYYMVKNEQDLSEDLTDSLLVMENALINSILDDLKQARHNLLIINDSSRISNINNDIERILGVKRITINKFKNRYRSI